ncbi:TniB family NTP-binding protein [Rossellomorea marisflavi]|uniref:TniB family NTP-binding protein n=1 Tax=Rossellomorea marisflavi TaxID=189381 RepID=UPI003459F24A
MTPYQAFAERVAALFVEHEKIKEVYTLIEAIQTHQGFNAKCKHMFVLGGSGVGKSKMAENFVKKYPPTVSIDEDGTEFDIKPVIYVETPHPFTWKELYFSILGSLGSARIDGKVGDLKDRAFHLLQAQQVKMVFLDEIHNILTSTAVSNKGAMEHLKHMTNLTNVSLVLMGTPEAKVLRDLDDQYKTRYRIKHLKRFEECDEEFCSFLDLIEEQLDPPFDIGLGDEESGLPQLLHYMSKGKVGFLIPIIQEAYRLNGVFEDDFNDFSKAKLRAADIDRAYKNMVGDEEIEED